MRLPSAEMGHSIYKAEAAEGAEAEQALMDLTQAMVKALRRKHRYVLTRR
jgi:hypothetical protein